MQGQRSAIGSLPETLGFDRGSTSSDTSVDPQIFWSEMQNSAHIQLSDYMLSPSHEEQNLSGWSLGEPSSSAVQNQVIHNERKTEDGWSSSENACLGADPMLEYESVNNLSLNNVNVNVRRNQLANGPLFIQSSGSDSFPRDLNIVGHGVDNSQVVECPIAYKSGGSENVWIPTASSSSEPFGVPPSGSGGYLVEENDGRPGCSLGGRRLSCKRKVLEGNVGQSSGSGSSNYFQPAEGSVWRAVPARFNANNSLSISSPSENAPGLSSSEQVNPRLGLGVGPAASETTRRNFRLRINSSHQEDSTPANVFPAANVLGHSSGASAYQRLIPLNNALDLRSAPPVEDTIPQNRQSLVVHVPALRRNSQSSRWSGGSSIPRPGGILSSHLISGETDAAPPPEEFNSRSIPRTISEHPMFLPATEMGNLAQNATNWSLTGGNISIPGNVASASRTSSSSGVRSSSGPNRIPHRNPPQFPRRLTEFVRRSLLSSSGSESGAQNSNYYPLRSAPSTSSQDVALSSEAGNQSHHPSHPRSAMLLERQVDGAFGIPYSLRTLGAATEGRSRLVSELRNVLDLMRRGEGLRFEDVMILDQSVFFGMADIHDQHRDMRLDVDNMSYEELLALEERIGNVSTGLSEETVLNSLKQQKYMSIKTKNQLEVEPCCICQEEYNDGEDLGMLNCGHDFHKGCIKQWLMHKNLCPICKKMGLVT